MLVYNYNILLNNILLKNLYLLTFFIRCFCFSLFCSYTYTCFSFCNNSSPEFIVHINISIDKRNKIKKYIFVIYPTYNIGLYQAVSEVCLFNSVQHHRLTVVDPLREHRLDRAHPPNRGSNI